jgi:hypothetical protein
MCSWIDCTSSFCIQAALCKYCIYINVGLFSNLQQIRGSSVTYSVSNKKAHTHTCYYYWITRLCRLKLILVVHPITHSTWFPLLSLKQTVAMGRCGLIGTVVTQIAVAGWLIAAELVPLAVLVGFMAELTLCLHISIRWIDWVFLLESMFFTLGNISTCKAAGDGSTVTGVCPFHYWISSLPVVPQAYLTLWHSEIPLRFSSLSIKLRILDAVQAKVPFI